jgi:hypothetical protein
MFQDVLGKLAAAGDASEECLQAFFLEAKIFTLDSALVTHKHQQLFFLFFEYLDTF